jgi:hypothetical protein
MSATRIGFASCAATMAAALRRCVARLATSPRTTPRATFPVRPTGMPRRCRWHGRTRRRRSCAVHSWIEAAMAIATSTISSTTWRTIRWSGGAGRPVARASRCRSPGPNSSNCSAGGSGKVPRVRARGRERRCIASAAHTWSPSHYRAHGGGNRRARHADLLGHPCSARCIGRSVHISRQGIFRDKPVTHVIYSNEHLDDIGGASLFPKGAATIAHRDTAALLAKRADPRRPLPTVTFDEHYALTVGGQTLELDYRGNNHEPGNIFIYAPRQKIVMLVDVVHPGHMPYKNLGITEDVQGTSKPIGNCCATTSTCSLRATSRGLERARTSRRRWPSSTTCAPPPDPCWPRHRSRTSSLPRRPGPLPPTAG